MGKKSITKKEKDDLESFLKERKEYLKYCAKVH